MPISSKKNVPVLSQFRDKPTTLNQPKLERRWLASQPLTPIVVLLLVALLGGCTSGNTLDSEDPLALSIRQTQQWSQSCALCHVSGVGGAPVLGNATQWQPRLAQGQAQLLTHTLEGYANMPPLGYCMSCDVEDFRALIAWMSGTAP